MSQSAIYVANTSVQNVAAAGIIQPGTVIRRFGPNIKLSGNGIQIAGSGYYEVIANVTLAPTAAGLITVSAIKDNVVIPGGTASATATAADDSTNLTIVAIVKEPCMCCDGLSNITFVLNGGAAAVSNIAISVKKL